LGCLGSSCLGFDCLGLDCLGGRGGDEPG
jgi:hypothetical protein